MTDLVEPDAERAPAARRPTPPRRSSCMPARFAWRCAPTSAAPSPASGTARRRSCARPSRPRSPRRASRRCSRCVPYSNRLGYRRFRWSGKDYTTRANVADSPHSLHGIGWQRPWRIVSSSALELVLELRHAGDADWPFAFDGAPVLHARRPTSFTRPPAAHQRRRRRAAGRPRLASVLRQAAAQPPAHRAVAPLGRRRDASCRRARSRSPASTATCRTSTSTTASKAGAARRGSATSASRSSSRRRCPTSSSTRRPSATTSASSR